MDQVIQFEGTIYEQGYGLIAQKVMRDRDLSPVAKTIYGYLCSFAGVGKDGERSAFPGVSLMMAELNIKTDDTFYKYRKQLVEKGYIKIEKRRQVGSKFDSNIYKIVAVPVAVIVEKSKEQPKEQEKPYPNLSGVEKPYPNLSCTEKPSTEKQGTIINSSIINSLITKREEEEEEDYLQDFASNEKESAESEEYSIALSFLEKTIGSCNPTIKDDLKKWVNELDLSIIMNEIAFAAKNNAKTYSYIEKMFIEDSKLQIDTLEQLELKRENHSKKKKSASPSNSFKKRENVPEWFEAHKAERNKAQAKESQETPLSPEMELKRKELLKSLGVSAQ
jgi:DnaD/phage-associated family protein